MSLQIRTFRTAYLEAVVQLYNDLIQNIPYNWPVTEQEFYDEVMGEGKLRDPDLTFDPGDLLIAFVDEVAEGFTHLATIQQGHVGLIRFLTYPPDALPVGRALLAEAVDRLTDRGCQRIEAWQMKTGYPFYTSQHGGCWEQSHLTNLFLANGFETYHREVVFHRTLAFGTAPGWLPREMRFVKTAKSYGNDVLYTVRVVDGDTDAARSSWHRMSAVSRHPATKEYGYVFSVSTSQEYRRQGLGRAMMQEMLHDMSVAGLKEALLHTMFDNIPAIGLYTRSGFRYIGTNIILSKEHKPRERTGGVE